MSSRISRYFMAEASAASVANVAVRARSVGGARPPGRRAGTALASSRRPGFRRLPVDDERAAARYGFHETFLDQDVDPAADGADRQHGGLGELGDRRQLVRDLAGRDQRPQLVRELLVGVDRRARVDLDLHAGNLTGCDMRKPERLLFNMARHSLYDRPHNTDNDAAQIAGEFPGWEAW